MCEQVPEIAKNENIFKVQAYDKERMEKDLGFFK